MLKKSYYSLYKKKNKIKNNQNQLKIQKIYLKNNITLNHKNLPIIIIIQEIKYWKYCLFISNLFLKKNQISTLFQNKYMNRKSNKTKMKIKFEK